MLRRRNKLQASLLVLCLCGEEMKGNLPEAPTVCGESGGRGACSPVTVPIPVPAHAAGWLLPGGEPLFTAALPIEICATEITPSACEGMRVIMKIITGHFDSFPVYFREGKWCITLSACCTLHVAMLG